jgi:hypothetical protein
MFTCQRCFGEYPDDSQCAGPDGRVYCDNCYHERFRQCGHCTNVMVRSEFRNIPGGGCVCHECYSANYARCYTCSSLVQRSMMINFDGHRVCRRCYGSPNWDSGRDIVGRSFSEIKSERRYGVELEVHQCSNIISKVKGKTVFGSKDDGTRGVAKEFVSPILQGDEGLREIRNLCNLTKGFTVNETCGYHLHIDCTDLSSPQCKALAIAYIMTYDVWASFVNNRRRDNRYCRVHEWNYEDIMVNPWSVLVDNLSTRYIWANWEAWRRHNTLEIRLHPGTLDKNKIINWVKVNLWFVDHFCNMSPRQVFDTFNGLTNDERFKVMCNIWKDSTICKYYKRRSKHYGLVSA